MTVTVTMGTRSLLYGAHAFWLHPWFVALAWWRLYGFPWDPRLWVAFFVHDLGYWGCPDMDGPEGERHPEFGARLMAVLFDHGESRGVTPEHPGRWASFCLYHSRYYAKRDGCPVSRLCYADKLSTALEPGWLYLLRVRATGELHEYMAQTDAWIAHEPVSKEEASLARKGEAAWLRALQSYLRRWVYEHADGRADTWTRDRVAGG